MRRCMKISRTNQQECAFTYFLWELTMNFARGFLRRVISNVVFTFTFYEHQSLTLSIQYFGEFEVLKTIREYVNDLELKPNE